MICLYSVVCSYKRNKYVLTSNEGHKEIGLGKKNKAQSGRLKYNITDISERNNCMLIVLTSFGFLFIFIQIQDWCLGHHRCLKLYQFCSLDALASFMFPDSAIHFSTALASVSPCTSLPTSSRLLLSLIIPFMHYIGQN